MAQRPGGAPETQRRCSMSSSPSTAPSAPPPPASRGTSDRAPRATQPRSAGRFVGNARQDDEEYDHRAEDEDLDVADEEWPIHTVLVGNVHKRGSGNKTAMELALEDYAAGVVHVVARANEHTKLALCFGADKRTTLMGNHNVLKVLHRNGGELLCGDEAWVRLNEYGVDCRAVSRAYNHYVSAPAAPAARPRPARAQRAPAPAPAPARAPAPAAPPPAPPPAVSTGSVLAAIAAVQALSMRSLCPFCKGMLVFRVATRDMGHDADFESDDDLPIAAGTPYMACHGFLRSGQAPQPRCSLRFFAGNCPEVSLAVAAAAGNG